jgi:hypothetical protein
MANRTYSAFTREEGVEIFAQPGLRRLAIVAGALLLIMGGWAVRTQLMAGVPGEGVVDALSVDKGSRKLIVSGWAGVFRPGLELAWVAVYVGDEELYASQPEAWERPDVVKAMKRPDWLNSGWRLSAVLPENLEKGRYPVKARALLENGEEFDLSVAESAREVEVP